jgi:hypothetical protein
MYECDYRIGHLPGLCLTYPKCGPSLPSTECSWDQRPAPRLADRAEQYGMEDNVEGRETDLTGVLPKSWVQYREEAGRQQQLKRSV